MPIPPTLTGRQLRFMDAKALKIIVSDGDDQLKGQRAVTTMSQAEKEEYLHARKHALESLAKCRDDEALILIGKIVLKGPDEAEMALDALKKIWFLKDKELSLVENIVTNFPHTAKKALEIYVRGYHDGDTTPYIERLIPHIEAMGLEALDIMAAGHGGTPERIAMVAKKLPHMAERALEILNNMPYENATTQIGQIGLDVDGMEEKALEMLSYRKDTRSSRQYERGYPIEAVTQIGLIGRKNEALGYKALKILAGFDPGYNFCGNNAGTEIHAIGEKFEGLKARAEKLLEKRYELFWVCRYAHIGPSLGKEWMAQTAKRALDEFSKERDFGIGFDKVRWIGLTFDHLSEKALGHLIKNGAAVHATAVATHIGEQQSLPGKLLLTAVSLGEAFSIAADPARAKLLEQSVKAMRDPAGREQAIETIGVESLRDALKRAATLTKKSDTSINTQAKEILRELKASHPEPQSNTGLWAAIKRTFSL